VPTLRANSAGHRGSGQLPREALHGCKKHLPSERNLSTRAETARRIECGAAQQQHSR
jgi:hypothetical protein